MFCLLQYSWLHKSQVNNLIMYFYKHVIQNKSDNELDFRIKFCNFLTDAMFCLSRIQDSWLHKNQVNNLIMYFYKHVIHNKSENESDFRNFVKRRGKIEIRIQHPKCQMGIMCYYVKTKTKLYFNGII